MSWQDRITADARLIILRELAKQLDGRLNEISLRRVLDLYSIRRSRDWLITQLLAMAELDAVTVTQADDIHIAAIAPQGRAHLEARVALVGISPPSELDI